MAIEPTDVKITVTNQKGYVQVFADSGTTYVLQQWHKEGVFLFLEHLRNKKKIKYNKKGMDKIYDNFIDGNE